jgi:cytochrome c oxidase subunit 4
MAHHVHEEVHQVGYSTYVVTWICLLVLTVLTVAVAGLELGRLSVAAALAIAAAKSSLVLNYFMHLKYEDRVFKIMLLLSIATLATITGLTFFDVAYR